MPRDGSDIMVFYPTEEEFKDFTTYVRYMESKSAHKASIVKVVPPKSWRARQFYDMDEIGKMTINAPILQIVNGKQGVYELTNVLAKSCTVDEFKDLANSDRFQKFSDDQDFNEIERKFWKMLSFNPPMYGADMPGSIYDKDVKTWNIRHLPSILDLLQSELNVDIPGVNTPYLYFGMCRALFPWHVEDMDLYSINYLHFGAPKSWYAIPLDQGQRFENLATGFFADSSLQCSQFLRHKTTLLSPNVLEKYSIPYNKMTQNAGEFIITFPHGYHSGFNHGFNCAESTNFASKRWIQFGMKAKSCFCSKDSVKIDMAPFVRKFKPEQYETYCKERKTDGDLLSDSSDEIVPTTDLKRKCNTGIEEAVLSHEKKRSPLIGINCVFRDMLKNGACTIKQLRDFNLMLKKISTECAICVAFNKLEFLGKSVVGKRSSSGSDGDQKILTSELSFAWTSGEASVLAALRIPRRKQCNMKTCSICYISVHSVCYSGKSMQLPEKWLCDLCQSSTEVKFAVRQTFCVLCNTLGGAMKQTICGRWVHLICAISNPLVQFGNFAKRSGIDISSTVEAQNNFSEACLHCQTCTGSSVRCAWVACKRAMHATCNLIYGVPAVQQEWPFTVQLYCPWHWHKRKLLCDKDILPDFRTGQHVVAKHKNGRFYKGKIHTIEENFFYRVIFEDGSYCKDVPPEDVKVERSKSQLPVAAIIPVDESVSVTWPDGLLYNARITGHNNAIRFQVQFEDDSLLFVKGNDIYCQSGTIPGKVLARMSQASAVRCGSNATANNNTDDDVTDGKRVRLPNSKYKNKDYVT